MSNQITMIYNSASQPSQHTLNLFTHTNETYIPNKSVICNLFSLKSVTNKVLNAKWELILIFVSLFFQS